MSDNVCKILKFINQKIKPACVHLIKLKKILIIEFINHKKVKETIGIKKKLLGKNKKIK